MSAKLKSGVRIVLSCLTLVCVLGAGETPVRVEPVSSSRGMVVAGHPEAARIGAEILANGGNAMDAAVAVSLALGVAEPYSSGLGGKLMLLYFDAREGRVHAVDAMDAAGWSTDVDDFCQLPLDARRYGWKSVAVPGLAAGLELAHRRWGSRDWAKLVEPTVRLARGGFTVLPKTRDLFAEREGNMRSDPELARLYLPGDRLPEAGSRLPNPDLAKSLELIARDGAAAFYRGEIARLIVAAQGGKGYLTLADFARYEAKLVAPLETNWRGYRLSGGPPPTTGSTSVLPFLRALEETKWTGELRTPENLARFGRFWREVQEAMYEAAADVPDSMSRAQEMLREPFLQRVRAAATPPPKVAEFFPRDDRWIWTADDELESVHASTTHFVVADAAGNVVSATQSLSLHFGAGLVAPGTGIILNDSMSNFTLSSPESLNYIAPGKRPRSTISPMIVQRDGRVVVALGVPGGQRIPTAVAQVMLDHFVLSRPLEVAIGDTRLHLQNPFRRDDPDNIWEVEESLPAEVESGLKADGWSVRRMEAPGRGRHFGGVNALLIRPDGTIIGYADPRRTNAAEGP